MYRRLARFAIIAAGATATGFTGYQAYNNNKRSAQTNFVDNSIPTLYSSTVVLTPPPPPSNTPSTPSSTANKNNIEYYSGQLTIQQHIARNDTVITGELHKTSSASASSTTGEKHHHSQHQYRYPSAVRLQVVNPRTTKTGEGQSQAVNVTNVNVNVDYDEKSVQMNELVSVSQDGQIAHRMDGVTDLDGRVMLVKNERDQVLARGLIVEQVRPVSVHVSAQKL